MVSVRGEVGDAEIIPLDYIIFYDAPDNWNKVDYLKLDKKSFCFYNFCKWKLTLLLILLQRNLILITYSLWKISGRQLSCIKSEKNCDCCELASSILETLGHSVLLWAPSEQKATLKNFQNKKKIVRTFFHKTKIFMSKILPIKLTSSAIAPK